MALEANIASSHVLLGWSIIRMTYCIVSDMTCLCVLDSPEAMSGILRVERSYLSAYCVCAITVFQPLLQNVRDFRLICNNACILIAVDDAIIGQRCMQQNCIRCESYRCCIHLHGVSQRRSASQSSRSSNMGCGQSTPTQGESPTAPHPSETPGKAKVNCSARCGMGLHAPHAMVIWIGRSMIAP